MRCGSSRGSEDPALLEVNTSDFSACFNLFYSPVEAILEGSVIIIIIITHL